MTKEKHPFDAAAEELESISDGPVADQNPSADFWELRYSTDDTTGNFPQAEHIKFDWESLDDSDGLGEDGFPAKNISKLQLREHAKLTDVLSCNLWRDGFLVNSNALEGFKKCNLGNYREYPVELLDHEKNKHPLIYLYHQNILTPESVDYKRSEFYLEEMLGIPKDPIQVDSFSDWQAKVTLARAGKLNGCEEFSGLAFKKLYLLPGHNPDTDIFRIARLGVRVYVTTEFRKVMLNLGVTGINFKINRRVYKNGE